MIPPRLQQRRCTSRAHVHALHPWCPHTGDQTKSVCCLVWNTALKLKQHTHTPSPSVLSSQRQQSRDSSSTFNRRWLKSKTAITGTAVIKTSCRSESKEMVERGADTCLDGNMTTSSRSRGRTAWTQSVTVDSLYCPLRNGNTIASTSSAPPFPHSLNSSFYSLCSF